MICWNGYLHFEISKCQCKFSATCELVILPSLEIAVDAEARIPLRHCEYVITIFRKIFIATATAKCHAVWNFIIPVAGENKFLARLQRLREFNTHHCFIDGILQCFAG